MKQSRRSFLKQSGAFGLGFLAWPLLRNLGETTLGHGDFRYRINPEWSQLDPQRYPIKDGHEMVLDRQGRLYLSTNHTQNNILVYDRSGKLLDAWGTAYPGAHGLTISDEGGEEFLYLTDYERHAVYKFTLSGKLVLTLAVPGGNEAYQSPDQFKPTETAIAPNGDIYVTDGYGAQWITVFSPEGKVKFQFGGPAHFQNAHGICLDTRYSEPVLLITAREQNRLKRFSLEGQFLDEIALPGAYINRPVIAGKQVYLSVLKSAAYPHGGSGFIMVLDQDNRVVSCPGGSAPGLSPEYHQTVRAFLHPHDVCVDADENLYIPQWNSGQAYPIQLQRV